MAIVYRSVLGSDLNATQIDGNFHDLDNRVSALEALDLSGRFVAYFSLVGNSLYIHFTDHTVQGPLALPEIAWNPRGLWIPDTSYFVNDLVYIDGSAYLVVFDHVSQAHFDQFANDGMGHDYYKLIFQNPSNILPEGGDTGMSLVKASGADLDVMWAMILGLPPGGDTGQLLAKHSSADGDAFWIDAAAIGTFVPDGGSSGQVLTKHSSADGDVWWTDIISTLAGDSDVSLNTPRNLDVLTYDGTRWYNSHLSPRGGVNLTSSGGICNLDPHLGNMFKLVPAESTTITLTNTVLDGQDFFIEVTTSGTTTYNISFSGTFVGQGTLATGTVNNKKYILHFVGYSSAPIEVVRTGPL